MTFTHKATSSDHVHTQTRKQKNCRHSSLSLSRSGVLDEIAAISCVRPRAPATSSPFAHLTRTNFSVLLYYVRLSAGASWRAKLTCIRSPFSLPPPPARNRCHIHCAALPKRAEMCVWCTSARGSIMYKWESLRQIC